MRWAWASLFLSSIPVAVAASGRLNWRYPRLYEFEGRDSIMVASLPTGTKSMSRLPNAVGRRLGAPLNDAGNPPNDPGRAAPNLRLGIITDEVSDDPHEACALIKEWRLAVIELRTAWGKNLLELGEEELDRVERAVKEHSLEVVGIASPVFKS